jgi:predicted small integral membrane protein
MATTTGDRLIVFAFAAFLVLAIVGLAFAAGYLIGRIFL